MLRGDPHRPTPKRRAEADETNSTTGAWSMPSWRKCPFIHSQSRASAEEGSLGKEGWPPPLCWVWLAFLPCGPLFLNKTWEQARGCSAERERTQASPDLLGKTLSGSWQARRCGPRGPLRVWLLSALSAGPAGRVSSPSAWRLPPAPAPLGSKHFHIRQPRRWAPRLQQ